MTPKQARTLEAVIRLTVDGVPPTLRGLAEEMDVSLCAIQRRLVAMKEAGLVTWEPWRARSLRVLSRDPRLTVAALERHDPEELRRILAHLVSIHAKKAGDGVTIAALSNCITGLKNASAERVAA